MRGEGTVGPIGVEASGDQAFLQRKDHILQRRRGRAATGPEQVIVWPETEPVDDELERGRFDTGGERTERWQGGFRDFAEKSQGQVNGIGSGTAATVAPGDGSCNIRQHAGECRTGPEGEENPGRCRLDFLLRAALRRHVPPARWPAPQWPLRARDSQGAHWFCL